MKIISSLMEECYLTISISESENVIIYYFIKIKNVKYITGK